MADGDRGTDDINGGRRGANGCGRDCATTLDRGVQRPRSPLGPGARPRRRLRVGPHLARLPGDVDPPAGLRDGQYDLRLHDDPRDVPPRPRDRGRPVCDAPDEARRSDPAAGREPDRRGRPGDARPRVGAGRRRTPHAEQVAGVARDAVPLVVHRVLPVTIALGVAFPASSALLPDEAAHAGQGLGFAPRHQHDRLDRGQPARAVLPDPARRFARPRRRSRGGQRKRRSPPRLEDVETPSARRHGDGRRRHTTQTERPPHRRRSLPWS